jgi:hypothetical protein
MGVGICRLLELVPQQSLQSQSAIKQIPGGRILAGEPPNFWTTILLRRWWMIRGRVTIGLASQ